MTYSGQSSWPRRETKLVYRHHTENIRWGTCWGVTETVKVLRDLDDAQVVYIALCKLPDELVTADRS